MAADRTPRTPHEQYRLADIPVDDAWVRKNNENLKEIRRLQWSAAIFALVLVLVGLAILFYSDLRLWGWFAFAAMCAVGLAAASMIVVIPKKMGTLSHTYATSELVPAMVAEVRPRGVVLMALVDRAVDRSAGKLPALASRSCEKLPGHDINVGERVPCVAVVANRNVRSGDNTYQFISPMPIAWATPDTGAIRRLAREIPGGEWERLRQNLDRVEEVSSQSTSLLPLD